MEILRTIWNVITFRCWVVIAQNGPKIKEVSVFFNYEKAAKEKQRMRGTWGEGSTYFCRRESIL